MAAAPHSAALRTAAIYVALLLGGNLAWEVAHVRLYTLWTEGSLAEVTRAVLHCTAGDGVLGASALVVALVLADARRWPVERFGRVACVATLLGLAVTVAIEWLAVEVWGRWAYAPAMPRLPLLGTGLTPILQWAVLPPLLLHAARRLAAPPERAAGGIP